VSERRRPPELQRLRPRVGNLDGNPDARAALAARLEQVDASDFYVILTACRCAEQRDDEERYPETTTNKAYMKARIRTLPAPFGQAS
jgi:hypothetical protein